MNSVTIASIIISKSFTLFGFTTSSDPRVTYLTSYQVPGMFFTLDRARYAFEIGHERAKSSNAAAIL